MIIMNDAVKYREKYGKNKKLTPLQAIKWQCGECFGYCENWRQEVKGCTYKECTLYPWRSGKSGQKRTLSDAQRKALSDRLKSYKKIEPVN